MNWNLQVARLLMALASAIFLLGAVMHALAFAKATRVIEASTLKPFLSNELKVLWLADSTTLMGLALIFGMIAARAAWPAWPAIFGLAWIPAATTALLYFFLGPFYAAHMLAAATLLVIVSAVLGCSHKRSIGPPAQAQHCGSRPWQTRPDHRDAK